MTTYFQSFDSDENDSLDRRELRLFLTQFMGSYHIRVPLTDEYVDDVFRTIDANHDNKIQPEELINFATLFVKRLIQEFESAQGRTEEAKQ